MNTCTPIPRKASRRIRTIMHLLTRKRLYTHYRDPIEGECRPLVEKTNGWSAEWILVMLDMQSKS